jgi:hypothetical protein
MKKLLAVIAVALVAATAAWIFVRVQLVNRLVTVPELLPKTTLFLVHVPDLRRARKRWQASDLYQIWREPAVQSWLHKPLGRLPQSDKDGQALEEFLQLGPTHTFVALVSLRNNEPRLVGGFHFSEAPEKAKEFIAQREGQWWAKASDAKHETIVYEQHQIEMVTVAHFAFARVFDNHWFFASNDLTALKALLDRVDRRREKSEPSLKDDEAFAAARKHLAGEYEGLLFVDPRPFLERLMPLIFMAGQSLPAAQLERLKSVRRVAVALGFEHGKMRETDFVEMPRVGTDKKLTRPLLATARADTFFYSVSRMSWPDNVFSPATPAASGLSALIRQFSLGLASRGISTDDLRPAFGEQLEMTGAWQENARWPTFLAALPVIDLGRARKIAEAVTSVEIAGTPWTRTERNGATIYSAQPFGDAVKLSATIAVSDKMMFLGSDTGAVEAALAGPTEPTGELERSAIFRDAATQVSAGDSAFNYVDTRLLFERANAAIRPLLIMGAAVYPALGKDVDLGKLPPSEAIAKHLSPIVMSQRYENDGYVTESVGPVTFREATIGIAAVVGGSLLYFREGLKNCGLLQAVPAIASPTPTTPSPSPTPSPF